ncbi:MULTISPECIES: hypothetical protein [Rhizobium]|uniref:Uncharacterized protein n=1 Tax=Rhizobium tropici TaxID=398 RepID=A0A6P1CE33_RHITR|nr:MULTISPECIES: hypothetical protein [Rhizobium]AGB74247.1 hypothetical protein RTCIAT899_PC02220 [Rhizobium tropici CIAT 899]MBB4240733.1 hypothetical protein [Rhizobium tropici]MBB5591850.1 hypothetical protein [Rhizobium tropici]MBB6490904.1 hypothetical protein [Rhizobium tropici]NEV14606.1 hypothetical protein [Rhizobium tropici]
MFRLSESNKGAGAHPAVRNLPVTASRWLALAAAPSFAFMTLLSAYGANGDIICSAADGSTLGGMVPMYLLMSLFHCGPWLRLLARQEHGAHAPG